MEAKVQYNDYVGTVAADISDQFVNSMDEYLCYRSQLYDKSKYHCIGCELRPYGVNQLELVFFCRHLETGNLVPMRFNQVFDLTELLVIFKRFAIVLGEHIQDVEAPKIETVYLD